MKKIFLGLAIVLIIALGLEVFHEFKDNHTYYIDMFAGGWKLLGKNWWLIIGSLVTAGIPTLYTLLNKRFSIKTFIFSLLGGLGLFSLIHVWINNEQMHSGILLIINVLVLFVFGAYFLLGIQAFGTWLSKLIKFEKDDITGILLKFGIGLGAFLIVVSIFVGLKLFYQIIAWLIFLGLGFMIWYMRREISDQADVISEILGKLGIKSGSIHWTKVVLIALFVFSIVYYFYGFQLSFIPYSTAWDANHAYMYGPKVIAKNHGLLRGNMGEASAMPYLWYMFITFWFSIGSIFSGNRLAPDTIAVAMNFLTGPLCLIFGLGLINEVIGYFTEKKELSETTKNVVFGIGWSTLLLWLTSGMGAFLVFVDNKTDLGVMALTILAILMGVVFLRKIGDKVGESKVNKESLKYIVLSGILFALAGMAKPSAFIDMVVFGLILMAILVDGFLSLGLGIIAIGMMGILQPVNAADFMTPSIGTKLVIIGAIICIISCAFMFIKHQKGIVNKKNSLYYIIIWGVSLFATLLVFKGPWLAYKQISNHEFSIGEFGKGLFMAYEENNSSNENNSTISEVVLKLLAATEDYQSIESQNIVDENYLYGSDEGIDTMESASDDDTSLKKNTVSIGACINTKYTEEELSEGMQKAEVTNEDVGRYVGYGWKEFGRNKGRLSFLFLKMFYPKNGECYGFNKDGVILCKNQESILNKDIDALYKLRDSGVLKEGKPAEQLLINGLEEYENNHDTLMDLISDLTTYYQNNSIYVENGYINVPYRYLVPLNITFNRSLQNLSSYYTDIGFIWIFVYILLILCLIYSIINIKTDKKLFALSMSTIIGRAIWWIIGGGILWYGIGLIMWSILVLSAFIQDLLGDDDSNNYEISRVLCFILCIILGVWMILQMFYNLIRISSQGSSGPFLWYKQSAGEEQLLDEQLSASVEKKYFYSQKDVFDLQFPHYNKFIEYVKDRADNDGVLIAGTYIQYFLDNQRNLKIDGSLDWFWEQGSDEDTCKMYHRLRNENIKYLVIDPNIASIVMGDGNKSLLYRFFAKIDENGKMIKRGAMVMLTQMIEDGYIDFLYSNNIGAKYAYTLSDDELKGYVGNLSDNELSNDELMYIRAQMSSARYMDNANELINDIARILGDRLEHGEAIGDIADIYGKIINEEKVKNAVDVYKKAYRNNPASFAQIVETLTQDERTILYYYLNIYLSIVQDNENHDNYNNIVNNLLSQSIAGGSQLMVFELK